MRKFVVLRSLAVLWGLGMLTIPGLALTDLIEAAVPQVRPAKLFAAAYGIVVGIVLGGSNFALLRRPATDVAPIRQIGLCGLAFLSTAVAAGRIENLGGLGVVAFMFLTLSIAHPARRSIFSLSRIAKIPRSLLAALGSGFWIWTSISMGINQRANLPPREGFALGPDSWDAITLLGCTIAFSAMYSSTKSGSRLHAIFAGIASLLFALISLWHSDLPGHLSMSGALFALAWGVVMLALASGEKSASQ